MNQFAIYFVTGLFSQYECQLEPVGDEFAEAKITFAADEVRVIGVAEQQDGHLKSTDFFDAEQFLQLALP